MPRIPDDLIERLKQEVLVEELARRGGVELRRVGRELVGRCPFPPHEDSTPSLSVNPEKNVFQCFGCGAAGTSIDWTMREKGLDFRQAALDLLESFFPDEARRLGESGGLGSSPPSSPSPAPSPSSSSLSPARPRQRALSCPLDEGTTDAELASQVIGYYHACLKESPEARGYLQKRGLLDEELIERFRLGYANRTLGMRLTPELRRRLLGLGFFREATGHEHLNGRLVVPILGRDGEVVGAYGRTLLPNLRTGTPKHLYLPGPRRGVFNPEAFASSTEVLLCEALIDALTFWRHGFKNVTSAYGVDGFNEELLSAFVSSGTRTCFLAFDRDEAGDEGARKVAAKLMAAGVDCYRVLLPKGMDVNEVALKMTPPDKTLGLFVRRAEWMGNGRRPPGGVTVHVDAHTVTQTPVTPLAPTPLSREPVPREPAPLEAPPSVDEAAEAPLQATEVRAPRAAEEEKPSDVLPALTLDVAASPTPLATAAPLVPAGPTLADTPGLVKLGADEAELLFEERRYRVRGLQKCLSWGSLRVTLKAEREGLDFAPPSPISGWHLDTLDLCSHRQRAAFEREASRELGVKDDVLRFDLGRIVRLLEAVQEQRIAEASAPRTRAVTLTEAEIEEGKAFWRSPDLFSRIAEDYTRCGLVGETTNKIASYVGATSRLLDRPLAIIIQSSSAAGKSTLMEKTLAFMPEEMREKYTAVSGKSLFYLDEGTVLSHKILAIVEEEGAERASYPLKILQSEGELVMASTGKDPHTGKLVTKVYRVEGPVMILLTTTSVEVDPELENRCLRLTVDESREQTRAIHELQRMRMTWEGHLLSAERERVQKLHQNAQRLLRRLRVHNPYAKHLTFVSDQTRTRRDHDKYLTLIETIALMHQYQRPLTRREVNGASEEYVDVTLEDLDLAGRLIGEIVGQHLSDLQPQTRVFLSVLGEMAETLCREEGVGRQDLRFSRRQIRERTGWHDTQVRLHLARLVDLEYVLVHRGRNGQNYVYELLWAGEGKDGKPFVLGLVDVEELRGVAPDLPEASTTTSTSRGEEGHLAGDVRGVCGPVAGGARGGESGPRPAPGAAFLVSEPKTAENAQIPLARRTRSYTLRRVVPAVSADPDPDPDAGASARVCGNGHDPAGGNGHRPVRLLLVNLLRFSPHRFSARPAAADELRHPIAVP